MKQMVGTSVAVLTFVGTVIELGPPGAGTSIAAQTRGTQAAQQVPKFEADPTWPKIPNNWIMGMVSSVAVDSQDHVWILQRPRSLRPDQKEHAAPPLLEFDPTGNFILGWGGPGQGYEWPDSEHGIFVDYKGYVWLGGSSPMDNQVLKFTRDGKFVMQIGHRGQSKGNKDTQNLNRPADTFVYQKTNELFIADGEQSGNRRVIVFDADTGTFKRMWGAFGEEPVDPERLSAAAGSGGNGGGRGGGRGRAAGAPRAEEGPGLLQFSTVHAARVSNDGLVYVSDRGGKRVQVFTTEGKYLTQVFIDRWCVPPYCVDGQTAASTAFSSDPQQRFLYVASRSPARVFILDRKTLQILDSFGRPGVGSGEFYVLHDLGVDSKGNLYAADVDGRRMQKFVYTGLGPMPQKNALK
jgi:hypothetical protein